MQDVQDNHEEAAKVAPQTLRLCQLVSAEIAPLETSANSYMPWPTDVIAHRACLIT